MFETGSSRLLWILNRGPAILCDANTAASITKMGSIMDSIMKAVIMELRRTLSAFENNSMASPYCWVSDFGNVK